MLNENIAVSRGLTVIELLATHGSLSLAKLHDVSGLPKSTLRRVLLTLIGRNFVHRSLSDNKYRLLVTLPMLSPQPQSLGTAALVSAAFPRAIALTNSINWPTDIHVMEKQWMRIVDSTRSASASPIFLGKTDRRVHLFGSATGLACLSTFDLEKVHEIFTKPIKNKLWAPQRLGLSWQDYKAELIKTRERGYGSRLGLYLGETSLDDKLAAIAVPIHRRGKIKGAISLVYPRGLMTEATFAESYLPQLQNTAREIEGDLETI